MNLESVSSKNDKWSHHLDFLVTLIGYAVGIGNFWRFPYLAYRNGGGSFLVAYWLCVGLLGVPLFLLEVTMGQFTGKGAIRVWSFCPLLRGVGFGTCLQTVVQITYYNLFMAYALYYLYSSIIHSSSSLPWSSCDNAWNSERCVLTADSNTSQVLFSSNSSNQTSYSTSSQEFWNDYILEVSSGIDHLDGINWRLFIFFIFSWFLVFLCVVNGIRTSGKVVYFTALFPYILLSVLFVRGVTLPGSLSGIRYFLKPDWRALSKLKVWREAATQVFYSLGPGWSGLITMASYNKFHHNLLREAFLIPVINGGTSFFAGCVVFAVIGFLSHTFGVPVENIASSQGIGLAFVMYPEALMLLPISRLWSFLFFFMIFLLGLDTMFVSVDVIFTAIFDEIPSKKNSRLLLSFFRFLIISVLCIIGIPFVTRAGIYILQLVDWYFGLLSIMLFCILELVAISHIYGAKSFISDLEFMLNKKIFCKSFLKFLWSIFIPVILLLLMCSNITAFNQNLVYNNYAYPVWSYHLGWFISMISILPVFLYIAYSLYNLNTKLTLKKKILFLLRPECSWAPSYDEDKVLYSKHRTQNPSKYKSFKKEKNLQTKLSIVGPNLSKLYHIYKLSHQEQTESFSKSSVDEESSPPITVESFKGYIFETSSEISQTLDVSGLV